MATEFHMATMEKAANDRINAALETISGQFGIEIPTYPVERLSARMQGIRLLERHAEILELIATATDPKPDDLPADVSAEVTEDGTPVVVTETKPTGELSDAEKLASVGFNPTGTPVQKKRIRIIDANTGELLNGSPDSESPK